jgi:hypothetical protein
MEKCVDEHMAAAAANQNKSSFTCRIAVAGCDDGQSQAAALVCFANLRSASRSM